eukprot:TRINITY_DN5989_c0_g1_i1.p1 TRINITY_DN5989_c0_g1~~TRINITY_DN5989_c0_g1_i1.p1  ORF type:complete len:363 (-),score=86.68 TRINITY_DN5989_c0_g1_i1:379-1467(-)
MGCQCSKREPDEEVSHQIDIEMKEEKVRLAKEVKILLLGAGESGKTTVLKQMMLHYGRGFSEEYRLSQRDHIRYNLYDSAMSLLRGCQKLGIELHNPETKDAAELIMQATSSEPFDQQLYEAFQQVWKDSAIQEAYEKAHEFQLIDSAKYFLSSVSRYREPSFVPTDEDVLNVRSPTTGVSENLFDIQDFVFRVVDVGGQRSERKKWLACFNDVTSVLFIIALSEFNQTLYEDGKTNRMSESMNLFRDLCDNRWFIQTPMIIFLNKQDLFAEKLSNGHSIKAAFPEFNKEDTLDASIDFIQEKLNNINRAAMDKFIPLRDNGRDRDLFFKITCATDKKQMEYVLKAIKAVIISRKLGDAGLF